MDVVGVVGGALLSSLFSWIFSKFNSSRLLSFNKQNKVPAELQDWRTLLPQIQAVLEDAEAQQTAHGSVETWLSDLKDLAYDMEEILNQFEFVVETNKLLADSRESTGRASCWPSLCSSRGSDPVPNLDGLLPKINEVATKLQNIDREKIISNFQQFLRPKPSNARARTPSTSLAEPHVYGREKDKESITELLLRHESAVCVIPITGMGGIGKTTLAQLVYNDEKVENQFDLRAWACVSEEFDILKVTRYILQGVTGQSFDIKDDLNLLQTKLKEALCRMKFLLVLDDVWNENYEEWDILRRPFMGGAAGSKIIVTTRSHRVALAMAMGHIPPYALETMPDDECLRLLAKHALEAEDFRAHPHLETVGRQIMLKCDGLPLAAKTLGGLLRGSLDLHYWEYILNSKIWDLPKERSNILPALRLSYHHLPSHLKRCFVYCAMFPKDWEFEKDQLVLLWMAEGFLDPPNATKRMEDLCLESFHELLSRAFFQKSSANESRFVMHDLIHDLAQSIAGESCLHLPHDLGGDQLQQASFTKARHFSFVSRWYDTAERFEMLKETKRLRTCFALPGHLQGDFWLSNKVLDDLLFHCTCLRVLSLRRYKIKWIPDSISNLTQLRYLDLSDTNIESLPESVTSLIYLQTLILRACRFLKMLPPALGNLIKLKYLDIRDTDELENIPLEILKMKHLQAFILNKIEGLRLADLKYLSRLKGQLSIKNLQNLRDVQDAKEANLERIHLRKLCLEWTHESGLGISNEMQVLKHLKPHNNLEIFKVRGYRGLELPPWIGNPSFSNLAHLEIRNCECIRSLPSVGQLRSLKKLVITGMKSVQKVGMEFYGVNDSYSPIDSGFPALEELEFVKMPTWEEWSCFDTTDPQSAQTFPHLKKLTLQECPKLREKLPGFLPSLHELKIRDCSKAIVNCMVDLTSLQTLNIQRISDLDEMVCIKDMKRLQKLHISNCPGLGSLAGAKLPTTLKRLEINNCENLKWLPEEVMHNDGRDSDMCFEELEIIRCPRLESFPAGKLPATLKEMELQDCQSLQSLPELAAYEGGNMLKSISIFGCPKFIFLPFLRIHNLPVLKRLQIDGSGSEDVIESFPESILLKPKMEFLSIRGFEHLKAPPVLRSLTSLTRLMMQGCPMIESFPEGCFPPNLKYLYIWVFKNLKALPVLHSLTSLSEMVISDCPMIESFPEGCFPPNLKYLDISLENVKQPMGEWGLDCLVSLKVLSINGLCPPDGLHVSSSLTSLTLGRLDDLKSISRGLLQSFACLQELKIWRCSNLEYLANDLYLPPSLGYFELWNCPLLAHKCKEETGEYWPVISHIPRIHILTN